MGRNHDPAVWVAHRIAGEAMEIAGPVFWAVLLAGVISDALGIPALKIPALG
ncbi:MAG: hypothetical protein ACREFQ_13085 [Stellaceae bacterium]